MVFKSDWEKTDERVQLPEFLIAEMISLAIPDKKLNGYSVISGGCANLNVKILLNDDNDPFILRIYLRDSDAAYREQKLGLLLKTKIPIPEIFFVGDHKGYRFAIVEFLKGITLRDLLLGSESYSLSEIMFETGEFLAKIHSFEFEDSGFFDNLLHLQKNTPKFDFAEFTYKCLKNGAVKESLGDSLINKIKSHVHNFSSYFPDGSEKNLVHADFDPSNILVNKTEGKWKINGILDWEFAFSGSNLCDVANMLRYTDEMEPAFESSFLSGTQSLGWHLPENWRISTHMLNLLSLLDCLVQSDSTFRPNQLSDICRLLLKISNFLDQVGKSSFEE